uniref:Uncharacterized protein n=1 Tax=Seriola lalandi dorsalis TaxID=1841481 RepID=A0A3B4WU01_SERLL
MSNSLCLICRVEPGDKMENHHTFLYFAYGSNLLKERLQLKNPSATVHCVARLKVQSDVRGVCVPFSTVHTSELCLFLFSGL